MKALSPRDRLIAILLPAMLLLVGYIYVYAPKQTKKLEDLKARIAKEGDSIPMPAQMSAERRKAAEAEEALAAARKGFEQLRQEVADTAPRWLDAARRAQAADAIAGHFRSQGLLVLQEGPATGGGSLVRQSLQRLSEEFAPGAPAAGSPTDLGQPWEIRFVGEFPTVLRVLESLRAGDDPILPLGLTMSPPTEGSVARVWTLTVWK